MCAPPDAELVGAIEAMLPHIDGGAAIAAKLDAGVRAQLLAAMPGLKERAKTLVELLDGAGFLFAARPLAMDPKAAEIVASGGRAHLAALTGRGTSPRIFDVLAVLGREESLARIADQAG